MGIITAIKPQKNKKRVNIYIDGVFAFGIDLETFMKSRLKVEQILTREEVEQIVKEGTYKKYLNKVLAYATLRPRSEKEIDDWMKRKEVHESLKETILNKLKDLQLLDDKKFTEWWINQRLEFKKKSIRELEYELKKKGIDTNVIRSVLSKTDIDERVLAKDLLNKFAHKWERYDSAIAKQKKIEYLQRKGFNWQVIKDVVK